MKQIINFLRLVPVLALMGWTLAVVFGMLTLDIPLLETLCVVFKPLSGWHWLPAGLVTIFGSIIVGLLIMGLATTHKGFAKFTYS